MSEEENIISLWYATSAEDAESIMEDGFWAGSTGRGIRFTSSYDGARRWANKIRRSQGAIPTLLWCEIDLNKYQSFDQPDHK